MRELYYNIIIASAIVAKIAEKGPNFNSMYSMIDACPVLHIPNENGLNVRPEFTFTGLLNC